MTAYQEDQNLGKQAIGLLFAPFVGLAYVIVLPFISIATLIAMAARKVLGGVLGLGRNLVFFGWRPSEAYLTGKKKKRGNKN